MRTVLVCEPQCIGFEHAEFNAALLRTTALAFPGSRIVFAGESDHVSRVRSRLETSGGGSGMEWSRIDVPRRYPSAWKRYGWTRLREEGRWCAEVRAVARSRNADLILLASVGPAGLLRWKSSGSEHDPRTLAFVHGVVASAFDEGELGRVMARALRGVFRFRGPESLRYVVLGDSILAALRDRDAALADRALSMDIPSLWATEPLSAPETGRRVRFGFFGVSEKGFGTFARVAARVRERRADARFSLVGFLNDREPLQHWSEVVDGVAAVPLEPAEYARRARSVTYALWTARPRPYVLTASASFVDAVAFGKPSIVLRNRFVEHYFAEMGDIGYLCDSMDEMVETVESILRAFPEDRYRSQCRNLEAGRRRFAPATVSHRLAAAASFSSP